MSQKKKKLADVILKYPYDINVMYVLYRIHKENFTILHIQLRPKEVALLITYVNAPY